MTEKNRERVAGFAAFLSFAAMGLGQLYNGQLRRAVVFYALEILALITTVTISTYFLSFHGVIILYFVALIFVGIKIFAVVDAFTGARRIGVVKLRRYNRWYVYLPVYFVSVFILIVFENPTASYNIPSASNMPTLLVGDYLYADKNAYHDTEPERGDVAVFKLPSDNQTDYLQRVVGLPGDNIQVIRGILHINGTAVARRAMGAVTLTGFGGHQTNAMEYVETLPNGVEHRILEVGDNSSADNTKVFSVPPGHYFMMGDNRDNSSDSRFGVGFVPAANLVGRVKILFFSQNGSAKWWQIWRWPQAIRFDRIGKEIE